MRRSAAPSQLLGNSAKKPRFMPPAKNNVFSLKNESENLDPEAQITEVDQEKQNGSTIINICSAVAPKSQAKLSSKKNEGENWHLEIGVKPAYRTKIGFGDEDVIFLFASSIV
ncbi:hypothetical protein JD844_015950 [Phrynosoma platyrhinos]|uniref:Uncharacterized protein n=1 Tax=Phrynosoma platyrhinos TaxID=52577 RepID=A0ABQ7SJP4_PHRPL|nr:hypothetical protein JD844_015950 [Phrynosoma platyrhinos]